MQITDSKYFVYGSPNPEQYGLYDPITERIAIVYHDLAVMEKLQIVLSSKYNLMLFELDGSANQIDNTCCFNWRMQHNIPVDSRPGEHILNGCQQGELVADTPLSNDEQIVKDQLYMMFCICVISAFCLIIEKHNKALGPRKLFNDTVARHIAKETGMLFPTQDANLLFPMEVVRDTCKVLYLGEDINSAKNKLPREVLQCLS